MTVDLSENRLPPGAIAEFISAFKWIMEHTPFWTNPYGRYLQKTSEGFRFQLLRQIDHALLGFMSQTTFRLFLGSSDRT